MYHNYIRVLTNQKKDIIMIIIILIILNIDIVKSLLL